MKFKIRICIHGTKGFLEVKEPIQNLLKLCQLQSPCYCGEKMGGPMKPKNDSIPERHMNPVPQSTKNVKDQIIKTNKPKTNFESNNISNNDFKKSPVTMLGEEEGINRWSAPDFQGHETISLYNTVIVDRYHYTFVKTHKMCNTKSES